MNKTEEDKLLDILERLSITVGKMINREADMVKNINLLTSRVELLEYSINKIEKYLPLFRNY